MIQALYQYSSRISRRRDEEALAPSQLADRMGITRGAVSKLADRLIAKGMLLRTANPEDRRAQTLALTQAGRALVPILAALADANDAEFFDHWAQDDRVALFGILRGGVEKRGLKTLPVD